LLGVLVACAACAGGKPATLSARATTQDATWEWAAGLVPGLRAYAEPVAFSAEDWTRGPLTLWADARYLWDEAPARCVAFRAEPDAGELYVHYAEDFGRRPDGRGVWTVLLRLGDSATLEGVSAHDEAGETTAAGCSGALGGLSASATDALHYRAELVGPRFECRPTDLETDSRCPPCVRCQPTLFFGRPLPPGGRVSVKSVSLNEAPACIPCSGPDGGPALVSRLNRAVAGHYVLRPKDGPAFFRAQAACDADRVDRMRDGIVPSAHGCQGPNVHILRASP
jgi:hypothetical protein